METTPHTAPVTLEDIACRKAALRQQIQRQQEVMAALAQEILAPLEPATSKAAALSRAFNTGMAVLDGIKLGIKVMRKFRRMFGWRR